MTGTNYDSRYAKNLPSRVRVDVAKSMQTVLADIFGLRDSRLFSLISHVIVVPVAPTVREFQGGDRKAPRPTYAIH